MQNKNNKSVSAKQENPKTTSTEKKKGWWRRYLDRLDRATDGKPPKCCG